MEQSFDEEDKEKSEGYSWEKGVERSWDLLTEDEKGLQAADRKRR